VTRWKEIESQVRERATWRCEYCLTHQSLQGATFHVEHTTPRRRGGLTELENLAWACPACNLAKADRVDGDDPQTGTSAPLFNPRRDKRHDHFGWNGYEVTALTSVGRATIITLDLNRPRRLLIRKAEELFGLFPPR
jgi:5-methylcytosine-specific restriction endonuclease McrA